jgi:predicted nucleic acid-binding protein
MAMTGADSLFVDTNVLVYANQLRSPRHAVADGLLRQADAEGVELWISGQVIREYLAAITRPQAGIEATPMPMAIERARFFVQRFQLAEDGPRVRAQLLDLLAKHAIAGKQVHDANLVATMLAHGITRLLTFNVADFRRFDGIITIETGPHA